MSLTCEELMEFIETELLMYKKYKKVSKQVEGPSDRLSFFQMALDERLHAGHIIGALRRRDCIDKEGQNRLWERFSIADNNKE